MIKIAPSILAANFARLEDEIRDVEEAGADYLHVDIMDGHFVPNITMGPLVVEAIRPVTKLPLDVHLMIENPDQYIESFAKAGSDILSVHIESTKHIHRTIQYIKSFGVKAGVVINPGTGVDAIRTILSEVDLVLVMTVNPGFGGQSFIHETLSKVKELKSWKDMNNSELIIEVDGGVNEETASLCAEAGAELLVAGSAIYSKHDRKKALMNIRQAGINAIS
jgi:ribulose-phosphate 3-epimerase